MPLVISIHDYAITPLFATRLLPLMISSLSMMPRCFRHRLLTFFRCQLFFDATLRQPLIRHCQYLPLLPHLCYFLLPIIVIDSYFA